MQQLLSRLFLFVIIFVPSFCYSDVELFGNIIQGKMVIGKTYPNTIVEMSGVRQKSDNNGNFVIGIHKDAPKKLKLIFFKDNKRIEKIIYVKQRIYDTQRISGLNTSKVSPPSKVMFRISKEIKQIVNNRSKTSLYKFYLNSWIHPTTGIITGIYGSQRILNDIPKNPHYGLDYANKKGKGVIAPQTGVVTMIQNDNYYSGLTLIIDHGGGISTTYLHLDKVFVKQGQMIKQGDLIGHVGNTGRSTGSHLDWRLNWYHVRLDPALLKGIELGISPKHKVIKRH